MTPFKKQFQFFALNFYVEPAGLLLGSQKNQYFLNWHVFCRLTLVSKAVKKKLSKQDFDFLYDEKKGGLYFNENGADKGFGEGGIIAILKGAPELTSGNLEFIWGTFPSWLLW